MAVPKNDDENDGELSSSFPILVRKGETTAHRARDIAMARRSRWI